MSDGRTKLSHASKTATGDEAVDDISASGLSKIKPTGWLFGLAKDVNSSNKPPNSVTLVITDESFAPHQ